MSKELLTSHPSISEIPMSHNLSYSLRVVCKLSCKVLSQQHEDKGTGPNNSIIIVITLLSKILYSSTERVISFPKSDQIMQNLVKQTQFAESVGHCTHVLRKLHSFLSNHNFFMNVQHTVIP